MAPAPADRRATGTSRDGLLARLAPVVTAAGYDLEDVSVTAAGKRSLVRVIVDADGGIDLDAVAEVSRAVSDALDEDAFSGPFTLEVTSPGVDRPLTEPRHWRRAQGRLVRVRVGEQELTGRVTGATDDGVVLDVDGAAREVGYAQLGSGKVQIEFNRTSGEG